MVETQWTLTSYPILLPMRLDLQPPDGLYEGMLFSQSSR